VGDEAEAGQGTLAPGCVCVTLDPAIFRVLVAQGATPEMLLAVVEAAAAAEEEKRAAKRAGNAERQARFRQRHNASNALPSVTERDEAAGPALDKESVPQTPLKEINPTRGVCIASAREGDPVHVPVSAKLVTNRLAMGVLVALLTDARERLVLATAVECWNEMAKRTGLATAKTLTDERRKRLRRA
jgi:hypothetical protein